MNKQKLNEIRKQAFDNLRALNCDKPSVLAEIDRLEREIPKDAPKWPWVIIGIAIIWAITLVILGI